MADPNDRLRNDLRKLSERLDDFWTRTYPNLSREERIAYWVKNLGEGVRWEEKNQGDPYRLLTPEAFAGWRSVEPAFDALLPDIAGALGLDLERMRNK